ncbi:MAG: histidine phosphatase family protein [Leptolyngbyaceae bacterium]|nr:histidine phosphatase family protein [Leptolyngbyaceae bacterium]
MSTRVILVRHGESTYNVAKRVQGLCDESILTEVGRIGARQVGAALVGIQLDAIYSSPLKRAKATANLIVETLSGRDQVLPEIQLKDTLREVNLYPWEGMTFEAIATEYPEAYTCWKQSPHELQLTKPTDAGEVSYFPIVDLYDQARQFWHDVLPHHPNQTILVTGHSAINRALLQTAMGLAPKDLMAFHLANCSISILNIGEQLGQDVQLEALNLTAHLGDPIPKERPKHKGPRILLVRHGETDWNRDGRFQGQIDVPLNENGRMQAQKCADFLAPIRIDLAMSSSLARPKETAEIILKQHPGVSLQTTKQLWEISHGSWEGKLKTEIQAEYGAELAQWESHPHTVQMPQGENLEDVWQRAKAGWLEVLAAATSNEDGTPRDEPVVMLVTAHDAINKALLCQLVGWGPEKFWQFKQGNGAVSVIDYPNGIDDQPLLQAMNITTFFGSVLDQTAEGAL